LAAIDTHSFETLKNRLEREMQPKAVVIPIETVAEVLEAEAV
jgi:hypothetical protein